MKKLSLILAIVMLACSLSLSAFAADACVATISSATATAGGEVELTIAVKNSPGIVGVQFFVGYDANVMSFVSAKAADSSFMSSISPEAGANPVKIVLANLSLNEKAGDITAATVKFKLADGVKPGNYTVSLSVPEAYDDQILPVKVPAENGIVSVGTADHTHDFTKTAVDAKNRLPKHVVYTCACGHTFGGDYGVDASTEIRMTVDSMTAYVNGVATTLDAAPVIKNDRTMLPVRFVAENLGATVGWDGNTQTVSIKSDTTTIEIVIGASTAKVNGAAIALDSPAYIEPSNNRTYLPVRVVAENLGATVSWDAATRTAILVK